MGSKDPCSVRSRSGNSAAGKEAASVWKCSNEGVRGELSLNNRILALDTGSIQLHTVAVTSLVQLHKVSNPPITVTKPKKTQHVIKSEHFFRIQ